MSNPITTDTKSVSKDLFPEALSDKLKLPSADGRLHYLGCVARGELPAMLVISGLPGAGKTTIFNFLQQDPSKTYTATTRYMPRERRPNDTVGDQPWRFEQDGTTGADLTGPESVIFSNVKYKGYYGFTGGDIVKALNRGEIPVMLVTSYIEMTQLAEALHNMLPVAPLVTLRVEVPQDILPGRIISRVGAHPEEHTERIEKLGSLVRADMLQTPLLHKVYDTRVVWNVTEKEAVENGYFSGQVRGLTPDALAAMMVEATVNAQTRAMNEAKDILTRRKLEYGHPSVPNCITEILDQVLLPAAAECLSAGAIARGESAIVIKAGLAAAIYLEGKGRPVSPDIDWTLVESPGAKVQMEVLMEKLCNNIPVWIDGKDKAVYHCEGIKGEAKAKDGTNVELDALLITRAQPDPKGFCFVCTHDEHDLFHRRTVETPAGYLFGMVPPEQLCVEKLLAGRGPEINKFDLFDASGLLAKYHLNPNLVKKMVEMQRFDNDLDADASKVIKAEKCILSNELLSQIGITEPVMQHIAHSMGALVDDEWAPYPSEERTLSMTALKQLAFLSSVERSLKRVEAIMHDQVFAVGEEHVSIGERFGRDAVLAGVSRLRAQVMLHAGYSIGMNDTFVQRALGSEEDRAEFFQHLDNQRKLLTK